jgi:hypothetical protein
MRANDDAKNLKDEFCGPGIAGTLRSAIMEIVRRWVGG